MLKTYPITREQFMLAIEAGIFRHGHLTGDQAAKLRAVGLTADNAAVGVFEAEGCAGCPITQAFGYNYAEAGVEDAVLFAFGFDDAATQVTGRFGDIYIVQVQA